MGFSVVMPGNRHAVGPDAEHFTQDDNPQALRGILRDFLRTPSASR